jgi:hypothetical protein
MIIAQVNDLILFDPILKSIVYLIRKCSLNKFNLILKLTFEIFYILFNVRLNLVLSKKEMSRRAYLAIFFWFSCLLGRGGREKRKKKNMHDKNQWTIICIFFLLKNKQNEWDNKSTDKRSLVCCFIMLISSDTTYVIKTFYCIINFPVCRLIESTTSYFR